MSVTTFAPRLAGQGASETQACLAKPPVSMISRFVQTLRQGLKRRAAIRALGALDERMLADIGIDRDSIEAETDAMLARAERGQD